MINRFMTRHEQFVLLFVAVAFMIGGLVFYAGQGKDPSAGPGPADVLVEVQEKVSPGPPEKAAPVLAEPLPPPTGPVTGARTVTAAVIGAVAKPGVYTLDEGARLQDLLDKAGGARPDADLSDINLAANVIDGSTLAIPAGPQAYTQDNALVIRGGQAAATRNPPEYTVSGWQAQRAATNAPETPARSSSADLGPRGSLVDLNRASAEELEALPGIGPVLAHRIVEFRAQKTFRVLDDLLQVNGIGPKKLAALRPLVAVGSP